MTTPYDAQPKRAFWRHGVANLSPLEIGPDIYTPRFTIDAKTRISAAGSCFAQHIARQFKARGYRFMDFEPAPPGMSPDRASEFGYTQYSARYGNIYSVRQLVQLFERAAGRLAPEDHAWQHAKGGVADPFRPNIMPIGYESDAEMVADRQFHLDRVGEILAQTDLFVFTFGLTEAWVNQRDGAVLPTCPGTYAGQYDPARYSFHNFGFAEVLRDAEIFLEMARSVNPEMRFLITVSPVPLTATATDQHVLAATIYSKSVLRAVCGELMHNHAYVDYFPSYELVAAHPMRASFYRPNLRNVAAEGVARVMDVFFSAHGAAASIAPSHGTAAPVASAEDAKCEEEILEMFSS